MCFAKQDKILISIGNFRDPKIVVWDLHKDSIGTSRSIACDTLPGSYPLNHVCAYYDLQQSNEISFAVVGQNGTFAYITVPNVDEDEDYMGEKQHHSHGHGHGNKARCHMQIKYAENNEEQTSDFTTAIFSPHNQTNCKEFGPLVMIGDDKGSIHVYSVVNNQFMSKASPPCEEKAVGCISFPLCPLFVGCQFVVFGTESGVVH